MLVDLLILIICSIAITLLALLIFVRNPSQSNNRQFGYLSLALVAWSVSNYLSDHAASHVLLFTRLTFLGGVAAVYTIVSFIAHFPNDVTFQKNTLLRIQTALTAVLLPITFLPAFVKSVDIRPSGGSINTSYLYWLFILYIAYSLILLFIIIRKQNLRVQSVTQKQQVWVISWGIILYAVFAVASNVLLPLVIDNWSSSRFGPAFTLFLAGMVGYAIVKHRLFDIRLIVARSIAYGLTMTTLAGVFTFITFVTINLLFGKNHLSDVTVRLLYTVLAVILALLFPLLRKFFNRISNKLFYRDAYDTQIFLDQFNKVLVANYELRPLLKRSTQVIEDNLKPAHCVFGVKDERGPRPRRIVGTPGYLKFAEADIELVRKTTLDMRRRLIVVDELEEKYKKLQEVLRSNGVSVIARLAASNSEEGVGYLVLGPKKSGNLYSSQDLNVIEIISNELVIAIQNALRFEEIEHFNVTLQEKVDKATKQLRQANERLKALDETKDDFISMASHQLRTPLTSIKGYISMVLEGDAGKISHMEREMLGQAFFSSQRMVYLIADLLNISRLKTGKFIIEPTKANLAEVVDEELDQLEETASARSLTLTYDKPKTFPDLMIDETKTRQVIMNFVDNAIYYTPPKGHINVRLINNPTTVELRVEDDGIGVPKTERPHLFTKFYRAGNARKARPDGTGLGLFMAKKVVLAQGGSIIFESQENKGSTFGFILNKHHLGLPASDNPAQTKPA